MGLIPCTEFDRKYRLVANHLTDTELRCIEDEGMNCFKPVSVCLDYRRVEKSHGLIEAKLISSDWEEQTVFLSFLQDLVMASRFPFDRKNKFANHNLLVETDCKRDTEPYRSLALTVLAFGSRIYCESVVHPLRSYSFSKAWTARDLVTGDDHPYHLNIAAASASTDSFRDANSEISYWTVSILVHDRYRGGREGFDFKMRVVDEIPWIVTGQNHCGLAGPNDGPLMF
jgi:hypothetical protein